MDLDAQRLVCAHADTILRVCYTYLHSRADAEDICQDVLIKLLQRGEPFDTAEHERAWVVRVAINACKDKLRKDKLGAVVSLDDVGELEAAPDVSEVAADGRSQSVLEAVQSLPLVYREPIYLHYYEGYSVRECAQLLGLSESAVAQRLSRARKQLKSILHRADLFGEGELDD